jgi:CheY-like chemotaxis protein
MSRSPGWSAMSETKARILMIDNDPDMHTVIEFMLAPLGYELTFCRTGPAGLNTMRRSRPDLLLLDIMLTEPNEGIRVACEMRLDPHLKDIPIIFMSAIGEALEKEYAKEICPVALAADMFLEKPLDAATVREAVAFVLGETDAAGGHA